MTMTRDTWLICGCANFKFLSFIIIIIIIIIIITLDSKDPEG